ncbi:MAG: 2Fe-2S iron-sulfur cluster-binding protein [Pseudomonadota bacterium]
MSSVSIANQTLQVRVRRGDAHNQHFDEFEVPRRTSQTVLDVVTWIQRNRAPDLSYRFACRVGMCGSCAMMVNGVPRWTCRSHVEHVMSGTTLVLEPLRNLPVIKDLTCDMHEFFDKWQAVGARFEPSKTRNDEIPALSPNSPERQAADAAIECINCAVCYAACDVVDMNTDYVGPAALNRAWTLQNDSRDAGKRARFNRIAAAGGCTACHSQANCSAHCPVELNPSASIAGLKRALFVSAFQGKS